MELYSECLRKKAYRTQQFAQKLADKWTKERGKKLFVYHCNHCFNYHITKRLKARLSQLAEELG